MEDLRQTALAYYTAATDDIRHVVDEFFREMDPKGNGYVKFKEFSAYMETMGCPNMSSEEFYDELKQCGNDELYQDDIITLFYIIQSNRPFCGGKCKKFVKGMYFTCLRCFDFDHCDYEINQSSTSTTATFSVCSQCYAEGHFEHRHQEFLDPIVLLNLKRMKALSNKQSTTSTDAEAASGSTVSSDNKTVGGSRTRSKKPKYERSPSEVETYFMKPCPTSSESSSNDSSHSHDDKQETTSNYSLSKAIVPAVNQQSKQAKMQTAIQFGQLVASIGSVVFASQLCTIM
ncbi:uncharacterized protein LOC133782063 isoform X1 [Humulus lupulus]|uniref:uncharacterized protein LOC133782063 isoform X1 n=1 Tax=Humulus lupulus TaxID=3486 RepID=UPI002B413656|nr:uncharacterized protein LOC133782063 isoform X1 [Humulus lupulus]